MPSLELGCRMTPQDAFAVVVTFGFDCSRVQFSWLEVVAHTATPDPSLLARTGNHPSGRAPRNIGPDPASAIKL